jgi:hypothetical protein
VVVDEDSIQQTVTPHPEEEEEDTDWIVQALTVKEDTKNKKVTRDSGANHAFFSGSDGSWTLGVGLEFDIGGTGSQKCRRRRLSSSSASFLVQAVARSKSTTKRAMGTSKSDRDGGDGWMGRIHAAMGANSMVPHSLMGAFPGDAVPP